MVFSIARGILTGVSENLTSFATRTGSLLNDQLEQKLNQAEGSNGVGQRGPATNSPPGYTGSTHVFENVYARLIPFVFPDNVGANHALAPVLNGTGGLVFPYNPSISEGVSVKYDQIELAHTNESYYAYKGTENVRINIADGMWTCDTFDNAVYALSVLHFFRSYSYMDFGRFKTGRPPSPMWFTAYGNYIFNRVPCFLEKADWSFPNDVDYVGIPEFGSPEYQRGTLIEGSPNGAQPAGAGNCSWMPMKFTVSSISLVIQHSPKYWTNWSLQDYYSGEMLSRNNGSFHNVGADPAARS